MSKEISIKEFLSSRTNTPIVDVRSPKEYQLAHIPGAINIPLFNDAERAMVGTTYKHEGREKAITQGLELVGPKMAEFVAEGKRILQEHQAAYITMHCWRGGMRSKSMATLFNFAGIPTLTITGGYKVYRNAVQQSFANPLHLIVLGGKTGSAKTAILQALQQQGEQIIDLEKLANHKGSAFGQLGEDPQPSSEYFENLLFEKIQQLDSTKRIWIEDESHLIGKVFIPETFWEQMRNAQVIYCDFPIEERINYLVTTYGNFDHEGVIESVKRITKKLGGQHAKAALEAYEAGDLKKATEIVLVYYDKTYNFGLSKRNPAQVKQMDMQKIEPWENAKMLIADLFN
ncbi:MAG: tRNA 2-selenouridine(34) synthase MnmH [Bacteroidetes bacterium]|nr:tRNA 2-selenouridine(34) synthase MnmH [Bacteroidota bacterium]